MSTAEQILKLAYDGSVKRVWQCPWNDEHLLFEFSDDYSVFDWGKMPDTIKNKGRALAIFGAHFFNQLSQHTFWQGFLSRPELGVFDANFLNRFASGKVTTDLQKHGLRSHFKRLVRKNGESIDVATAASLHEAIYMEVMKAEVHRPTPSVIMNQNVFSYPTADLQETRLIPLEVVFRFGMPEGSSLKSRLQKDPDYAFVLGLDNVPQAGKWFPRPVLEFYTKLEPKDRLLSIQEALLISGLNSYQMQELCDRAFLTALALYAMFSEKGIELWDGKFEFILSDGEILLADSIGPDELRLLYKDTHLSKEMIRQVYRGSAWETSLKKAQKLAKERASLEWKEICKHELNSEPEKFSADVKYVIDKLYPVLVNKVAGEEIFQSHPELAEFVKLAHKSGLAGGQSNAS